MPRKNRPKKPHTARFAAGNKASELRKECKGGAPTKAALTALREILNAPQEEWEGLSCRDKAIENIKNALTKGDQRTTERVLEYTDGAPTKDQKWDGKLEITIAYED